MAQNICKCYVTFTDVYYNEREYIKHIFDGSSNLLNLSTPNKFETGGHYIFFVENNLRRQTLWMLLWSHLLRCFPKTFLPWAAKNEETEVHQWHRNRPHSPCPETKSTKFDFKDFTYNRLLPTNWTHILFDFIFSLPVFRLHLDSLHKTVEEVQAVLLG